MISFLAPLDINDANDKEIPDADQLWTNHCRAKTRSQSISINRAEFTEQELLSILYVRRCGIKRSQNLPTATQLINGCVRLKTQVGLTPEPRVWATTPRCPKQIPLDHQVDQEYEWTSQGLRASWVAQMVKNLPEVQETWVQPLSWEDPLEKEMT